MAETIEMRASAIAGASWDDRDRIGTLADQLRTCAHQRPTGGDGDLSDEDRDRLLALALEAEAIT